MSNNDTLNSQEKRIFSQQINLPSVGIAGQERLKNSKVLVVGAGGKGSTVLQLLAKAGIGTLGITDNFLIEETELPRQAVYGCKDLGKLKAIAVKEKLSLANNFVKFNVHNICLAPENVLHIIGDYDMVVDTTDNFPAKYLINDACVKCGKPFVYGAINNSIGLVSVFNYKNGPSLRCLYPETPKGEDKPSLDGMVSFGPLLAHIGSFISNEVIKVLLGIETKLSDNLLIYNALDYSITFKHIVKKAENFDITAL